MSVIKAGASEEAPHPAVETAGGVKGNLYEARRQFKYFLIKYFPIKYFLTEILSNSGYRVLGSDGVIVLASDTKLSVLAERTCGKASRCHQIAKLNGLEGKGYKEGDVLALP